MQIIDWITGVVRKFARSFFSFGKPKHALNVLQPILNQDGSYIFFCPGCEVNHLVSTVPKKGTYHTLTGTLAKPTIRASVLVPGDEQKGIPRCHAYITGGMIEYLGDSTHKLAGKTVSLEPL